MPATPTLVTLVWLGVAPRHSDHETALARFEAAHHVRFQPARSAPPPSGRFTYDSALVLELEGLLEKARLAAGALDDSAALGHVEQVEQLLRAHAELPQAPWLMAERLHIEAAVMERRPAEQARARDLHRAAQALEGERAPVYRPGAPERADAASSAPPASPDPLAPTSVLVRVAGLRSRDALEWNGRLASAPLRATPGLHHVRVVRDGQLVLARWLDIASGARDFVVTAPAPPPCSASDLTPVRLVSGRIAPPPARCRSWAVARSAGPARVDIALCGGARCGRWTRWPPDTAAGRDPRHRDERTWQTWAPYAIGGLAVIATTGVVLWRLGVFDRDEPQDRVVFTGPGALTF